MHQQRLEKLTIHRDRFSVGLQGIHKTQEFTEKKQEELSIKSPLLVKQ